MAYAVRFEEVTKRYNRGGPRYPSFRQELAEAVRQLGARLRGERPEPRGALALDRVSFRVEEGGAFAIIGPNGAGKTTALKLIARISYPTGGCVRVRGRVAALIEVGSGVHPELTARENIWLYGQILGMSRSEIRQRFGEIVEFAELGHVLDTPVKMYSSGMQLRLGFAIAAHLRPNIFVVDEALAVGDAEFQRKCLAKLRDLGGQSSTILFVSHNMAAIKSVCTSGLLLDRGHAVATGPIGLVADQYVARRQIWADASTCVETELFAVEEVSVGALDGGHPKTFGSMLIRVALQAKMDVASPGLYIGLLSADDYRLAGLDSRDFTTIPSLRRGERATLEFQVDRLPLMPGTYEVELHTKDMSVPRIEFVPQRFAFQVTMGTPIYGPRGLDGWFGKVGLSARARVYSGDWRGWEGFGVGGCRPGSMVGRHSQVAPEPGTRGTT